jgi:hypothetical protein
LKPAFSPDGKKVFFVEPSWRALRSRIWYLVLKDWQQMGWAENLGELVNSPMMNTIPCYLSGNSFYGCLQKFGWQRRYLFISIW